jgi:glycosyltransferase 2 family protein
MPLKRILGQLVFAAGLGVTIWLVLRLGLGPILHALAAIGVGGILLLALAHAPTLVVLGGAWRSLARDAPGASLWTFVWGRMMRDAGGELLPFSQVGGFALGARAAALGGAPWFTAAASSLLDVFVEQATKAPYTAASVALLMGLAPDSGLITPALIIVAFTAVATGLLAIRRRWVRAKLEAAAAALAQRWPGRAAPDPEETAAAVRKALAPGGRIGLSAALHLTGWLMGAAEAWLAFRLLDARLDFAQAMVVDGLYMSGRIFVFAVPAAAGVQEAAYVVLAGLFHVPAPTALAFSLVRRARDLVIGAPALLVWQLIEGGRLERRRSARA